MCLTSRNIKHSKRPRVKIINPPECWEEKIREALMDQEVSVLHEDEVLDNCSVQRKSGYQVVPGGHLISLLKDMLPPDQVPGIKRPYMELPPGSYELICLN